MPVFSMLSTKARIACAAFLPASMKACLSASDRPAYTVGETMITAGA